MHARDWALIAGGIAIAGYLTWTKLRDDSSSQPSGDTNTQPGRPSDAELRQGPPQPSDRLPASNDTSETIPVPENAGKLTIDADPRFSLAMDTVNHHFEKGEFARARAEADKLLTLDPGNVRMLRVATLSACSTGNAKYAQSYLKQLTQLRDRTQMIDKCKKLGVDIGVGTASPSPDAK